MLRRVAVGAGFLLPTLTLLPLGWLWLWERGYAVWWAIGLLVSTLAAFAGQAWIARRLDAARSMASGGGGATSADLKTPREAAARKAVADLAAATDPATLQSRDAIFALGVSTVETVAHHMHPGEEDPVWKFTLPEALALIETTAARLRPMIVDNVPFGDRITVGQALRIYGWRGAIDVAEKAYDLWRIVRLANPLTALTQEARETMTKKLYEGVRDEFTRRVVRAYVEEIGRAAIDLYSGRLRILDARPEDPGGKHGEVAAPAVTTPLRILIAGQTSAGKSSLVNALIEKIAAKVDVLPATRGFTTYELVRDGVPQALLIDSAGLGPEARAHDSLLAAALDADLVLWVAPANRADRDIDRRAIEAVRARYGARIDRRPPPMLLVLSHIDRLRPFQEWQPPYDVADGTSEKARSIRAAMDAASQDLGIGLSDIVPVCLDRSVGLANVDLVWARLAASLPEVEAARLARLVGDIEAKGSWRTVLNQAMNAGRIIGATLADAARRRNGGG